MTGPVKLDGDATGPVAGPVVPVNRKGATREGRGSDGEGHSGVIGAPLKTFRVGKASTNAGALADASLRVLAQKDVSPVYRRRRDVPHLHELRRAPAVRRGAR
jgi:hypothetical protein